MSGAVSPVTSKVSLQAGIIIIVKQVSLVALQLAAHLKSLSLGTSVLIIESDFQIGDNWQNCYEYFSLHLPH